MLNKNLYILLEATEVGFLNRPVIKLQEILNNEDINWLEIQRLSEFHGLRPILAAAFKKCDLRNCEKQNIEIYNNYTQIQAFYNLKCTHELTRILEIFAQKNIKVLPTKGNIFIQEFYDNQQLREVGDIDLLFHPDCIRQGFEVLLNEGYCFSELDSSITTRKSDVLIEGMLSAFGQNELTMKKDNFTIDVHWGLNYGYLPYRVDYLAFFENARPKDFYGKKLILPDTESMFWHLILHHGGKENWFKIKHLIDLMAFVNTYQNTLDWHSILNKAKTFKLYNLTLIGFWLIEKYFVFVSPLEIQGHLKVFKNKNIELIIDYWDYAKPWDEPIARLKYERALINNQDPGFSKISYMNDFIKAFSKPYPIEHKRFINFSEKYPKLNFLSKVVSYLIKRTFKIK